VEWPTLLVALGVWGAFVGLVVFHESIPTPLLIVGFAVVTGWYMSLQHEVIHGHPTPWNAVNLALAGLPLYLWLPFARYRDEHLDHHEVELTVPGVDPESFYCPRDHHEAGGRLHEIVCWTNRTLVGRLLIGPAIGIPSHLWSGFRIAVRDSGMRWVLVRHVAAIAAISWVVFGLAGVPVWVYLLGSTYFGTSVTYIRSFAEHLVVDGHDGRTAVVRSNAVFGVLFLWNNLHVTHHALPGAAWYRLPRLTDEIDAASVARSGAGFYGGYGEVFRRYAFRPISHPVRPDQLDPSASR
jgi:fatty acid desaturase